MKKAFSVIAQFLTFLLVFLAGSLLDPFGLKWFVTHPTNITTKYFVPDGLLLAVCLLIFVLLLELLLKKIRTLAPLTSAAFALAILLGLLMKFGFGQHDLY